MGCLFITEILQKSVKNNEKILNNKKQLHLSTNHKPKKKFLKFVEYKNLLPC